MPREYSALNLEEERKKIDWSKRKHDFVLALDPARNKIEFIHRPLDVSKQSKLGRPGLDLDLIRLELSKLDEAGEIKKFRGWRTKVSERLRQNYIDNYSPKKPPQTKTIRERLKPEFDALESRLKKP